MIAAYKYCTIIGANGERQTMVTLDRQIDPLSSVYLTSCLRRLSGSFNTVVTSAIAIAALLSFCMTAGIPLYRRITTGRLLLDGEWRRFLALLSAKASDPTVSRRARDALRFLDHWANWWAETIEEVAASEMYLARVGRKLGRMHKTASELGGSGGHRDALPSEARKLLVRILRDEAEMERLWPTEFARVRNRFILWWFLVLGNRVGETLGLLVSDLHVGPDRGRVSFVRRQDSPVDRRVRQPSVKGESHDGLFHPGLLPHLVAWLEVRLQACPETMHLLVSRQGKPLSLSSIAKVFRRLGEFHPEVFGKGPHDFRHTWVANARAVAEAGGDPEVDAAKAIAGQLGHGDLASALSYGRAQQAEAADRLMLRVQENLLEMVSQPEAEADTTPLPAGAGVDAPDTPSEGRLGRGDGPDGSRRNRPVRKKR